MILANVVGVAAALCSMTSFAPQIAKIVRDRDASEISLNMYLVTVTGFCLWSGYGLLIASWPVTASNLVYLGIRRSLCAEMALQPAAVTALP